jgi:hypothetical protein
MSKDFWFSIADLPIGHGAPDPQVRVSQLPIYGTI